MKQVSLLHLHVSPDLFTLQPSLCSASNQQDEEDQAYLMDEAGNIEPSQTANTAHLEEEFLNVWGDSQEDLKYAESLEDFEQNSGEIPDQLMLELDM